MKTFACKNCGHEVRRPTAPLKCDACGQQRIGLFKESAGGAPAARTAPQTPTAPATATPDGPIGTPATPPADVAAAAPPPPPGVKPPPPRPAQAATQPPVEPQAAPPSAAQAPVARAEPARPAPPPTAPPPTAPPPTAPPPETVPPAARQPTSQPAPQRAAPPAPAQPAPQSAPQAAPAASLQPPTAAAEPSPVATSPGSIVWRFPVYIPGQDLLRNAVRNCVAVDGDTAYACIGQKLIAFSEDQSSVNVLWEQKTGGQIPGSPSIGPDGRIRVHSGDGRLYCVTPGGDADWEVRIGEPLGWPSPVVDEDNNTWICGYEGGLYRVDAKGKKQDRPFFYSRQKFDSTPLIHRSVLYVGGEDGFIYAIKLDGLRGKNIWDHMADRGKTDWFINSGPALMTEESLVVAGRDEYLYTFNLDGSLNSKLHIRGQMLASAVIDADDNIYVGLSLVRRGQSDRGKLVSIDAGAQRVRWEYETSGAVESTPVIGDDGTIYVGDNAGTIHAVTPAGKPAWRAEIGSPIRSGGTILASGNVVFGADDGTLAAVVSESQGLAHRGWPKQLGSAGQSGAV